ncbi:MAG: GlsB/YeaQ/YmgE family stress response rane protein [Cyanobacteria bacterium RYN_339]|nr:GlsB/YeaQ/YmgE family stress response rane protein [Cyanobacteria bacterium RYN_339]
MLGFLVMLLVAAIIGFVGEALVPGAMPGGWAGAIVAGLLGSALGGYMFGGLIPSGPVLAGFALIPSIIGAALVVLLFGLISRAMSKAT